MSKSVIASDKCSSTDNTVPRNIHTTCAYCGVGCGVDAQVNDDTRSITIQGLKTHPSNYGRLCSKGSALADTIGLNERLLQPVVHGKTASWGDALNTVADGFQKIIKEHGPDAVAFYGSGQLLSEDYYVANKLMKGFIGSGNMDTNSRLCMSSSVVGHKRVFGTDTVPGCYEDFELANLIILVGSNTAWCHPVLFQRIKKHKENNPHVKVVVVDPRKTSTCDIADLHLPINLGTDVWLFNGLLSYLAENNKLDLDYINNYCQGFEQSLQTAQLSSGDLKANASILGIKSKDLETFYQWFSDNEKVVTLYSQGVNQSSSGTDKVNAIINCHLATGRIGKPGMSPFSMTGQPNAMGGREVGGLANTIAGHMDFTDDNIDRIKRFWNTDNLTQNRGLMAVDLFDAIDEGKIKAVWIMATNPVVSMPNADKVKNALQKCDLVVVSDCIEKTDTMELAHVKLPTTTWSEKDGTVTNSERRISRQRALLPAAGQAKHDWWIICQIAKRIGFKQGFNFKTPADIFREHAALSGFENNTQGRRRDFDISGLKNISNEEYENLQPIQWPVNAKTPNGSPRFFGKGSFYTPNQKSNFLALTPKQPRNLPSQEFPLALNTGRIRDQWHTMSRTGLAPQLNQHISEPFVQMHGDDAKQCQLKDGQIITVSSRWGKMMGRLNITPDVKVGDIFAPMHWTNQLSKTGRINSVVNPVVDEFSKQPESKFTPVKVFGYQAKWHGFILSREEIDWPAVDYLVSVKGKQQYRYELAHNEKVTRPIAQMLNWLGIKNEAAAKAQQLEILSYQDAGSDLYRLALINKGGQLQGVAFMSSNTDLPERTWLAMQFEQSSLTIRARHALLSGYAPAGEDIGAIVCACYSVGEKTVEKAIREQGCHTTKQIGESIKAGTNCGSCIPELKQLIIKCR